ncbi:hypothetical protein WJX72_002422 [[Myrmecia] bisecta]|uniref:Uncharacterized protein n=1 Tax=[Myrmecia] bisecta TaxID=41462 RepID=A0AAW1QPK4_9CHLO
MWKANGSGFAANIRFLALAAALYKSNGTLYIEEDWYYKCSDLHAWPALFHGPTPLSFTPGTTPECSRKTFDNVRAEVELYKPGQWDVLEQEGLSQVWHLAPFLRQASAKALRELLHQPAPHIAFHVRGGDKFDEDQRGKRASTYPEHLVASFEAQHPTVQGGTCILIGDDHKLINQTQDLVRRHLKCKVMLRGITSGSRHEQVEFNRLPLEDRCAATQRLIVDLEIMAQAEYFVGSPTSDR